MESMIEVKGLKKYFKEVKAVDDVSFAVEPGELFGFLGVNGAGKSTTVNMLCTLFMPTAGEVRICGYRLGKEDENIRKSIGVVWQHNCLDGKLTVKENLLVRGSLYGYTEKELRERVEGVCRRLFLEKIYNRRYAKLSGGQKRLCELGAALIHTPRILFLDEPTTGLDPATRKLVWESLESLRQEAGMTIFLTTHYMEEAARAGHIVILDNGKIREFGTPFELKEKYARDKLRLWPKPGEYQQTKKVLGEMLAGKALAGDGLSAEGLGEMLAGKGMWEETPAAGSQSGGLCGADGGLHREDGPLTVNLKDSMAALPLLDRLADCISGFELVQGSMDDVFLNVTGKRLNVADMGV